MTDSVPGRLPFYMRLAAINDYVVLMCDHWSHERRPDDRQGSIASYGGYQVVPEMFREMPDHIFVPSDLNKFLKVIYDHAASHGDN